MNTVIERLEARISELIELLEFNRGNFGSQRKEYLEKQIKNCGSLIEAYRNTSTPLSRQEAEEKLNQQVGFEKQKKFILEWIGIRAFTENRSNEQKFPIFCFVGPSGVGKTYIYIINNFLNFFRFFLSSSYLLFYLPFSFFSSLLILACTHAK